MSEAFSFEESADGLAGPIRTPRNSARHLGAGSIHDDATAQKLGFRGGTVAGSLHMEQFPPLLVEVFGDDWLSRGGLSLYFKYATTDGEPVRAYSRRPDSKDVGQTADAGRTEVWMDDASGNRVCDGSATLGGPDAESTLRQRIASMPEPRDLRILAKVTAGTIGETKPTKIAQEDLERRLAVVTEPLPAYSDASIYGHKIATPALQVQVMRPGEKSLLPRNSDFGVGLFGGIELQLLKGPVFVDYDYQTHSRVLAVGETPKTEYLYYESTLTDPSNGADVLSMIMMLRFMKASSSLWE
jgi:hypothetical protein